MERLSGDQKGKLLVPSVLGSGRVVRESSGRSQSWFLPSTSALNARLRPSGEIVIWPKVAFSGGAIVKRAATASAGGFWRRYEIVKVDITTIPSSNTAAIIQPSHSRLLRIPVTSAGSGSIRTTRTG